jgi:hypothetical protein
MGLEDLAAEQKALVDGVFQSAMDMQVKQTAVAKDLMKSTMPVIFGGTVVLPIIIAIVTLVMMACIFGIVWLSLGSFLTPFR